MFRRIERSEINGLASDWLFDIPQIERDEFKFLSDYITDVVDELSTVPDPDIQPLTGKRDAGRPPNLDEDPYNAVVRWCSVCDEGAEGPLQGRRIGLKDNIAVSGVPLTGGSKLLEGFVPT